MTAIHARKTSYAGVLMRSRLEADYAAHLDRKGMGWEYEPVVFAGPAGQWLPDFKLRLLNTSRSGYAEVKPVSHLECKPGEDHAARIARIDELLSRMAMTWLTEPDAYLYLVWWHYDCHKIKAMLYGEHSRRWMCVGTMPFLPYRIEATCERHAVNWPPDVAMTSRSGDEE